jgi:hypothetical protein
MLTNVLAEASVISVSLVVGEHSEGFFDGEEWRLLCSACGDTASLLTMLIPATIDITVSRQWISIDVLGGGKGMVGRKALGSLPFDPDGCAA